LAAVEADGADSDPAALDADIAGLDVAFADPRLRSALRAFGAEVVGLEFHVKVYHKCGVVVETKIFRKTIRSYVKLICFEFLIVLDSICALPSYVWCLC